MILTKLIVSSPFLVSLAGQTPHRLLTRYLNLSISGVALLEQEIWKVGIGKEMPKHLTKGELFRKTYS